MRAIKRIFSSGGEHPAELTTAEFVKSSQIFRQAYNAEQPTTKLRLGEYGFAACCEAWRHGSALPFWALIDLGYAHGSVSDPVVQLSESRKGAKPDRGPSPNSKLLSYGKAEHAPQQAAKPFRKLSQKRKNLLTCYTDYTAAMNHRTESADPTTSPALNSLRNLGVLGVSAVIGVLQRLTTAFRN